MQDYARMIFEEEAALVVRLDTATWILEGAREGIPDFGTFHHVSLFESLDEHDHLELMSSCDCMEGRSGEKCLHQQVARSTSARLLSMEPLSATAAPLAVAFAPAMHGRSSWYSVLSTRREDGGEVSLSRHDQKRHHQHVFTGAVLTNFVRTLLAWKKTETFQIKMTWTRLGLTFLTSRLMRKEDPVRIGHPLPPPFVAFRPISRELQRLDLPICPVLSRSAPTRAVTALYSSPTPLSAFCTTVQNAYDEHSQSQHSPPKFLARSTFIKIFFAFVQLQAMDISFSCPVCGPSPSTVIADGVVLAHSTRLRHEHLCPPTTPSSLFAARPSSSPILAFLPTKALRGHLRRCVDALPLPTEDQSEALAAFRNAFTEYSAINTSSNTTSTIIKSWTTSLLSLLRDTFAYTRLYPSLEDSYDYLLKQLAAEEGIFQFCRPLCVPLLKELADSQLSVSSPRFSNLSTTLSRHCPALGLLLRSHLQQTSSFSSIVPFPSSLRPFLSACAQYIQHQQDVLLQQQSSAVTAGSFSSSNESNYSIPYTQTGSYYGSLKSWQRPYYTGVDTAKNRDSSVAGDEGCRKFYDAYVKQRRTGGIMALWCPHTVCVGFHIIPESEGRNDVFSALFSHWTTAPQVVVYDFACQLAPYCLRREAEFFKDTLFVIDQMHQHGHSKCTLSSFLSSYMATDPSLRHLNSSAAECENSALSRIKKSVSYSGQEHAVLLIKHFLCIWNRLRIKKK
ncbi:hypothetical protein CF335_g7798 [Tilletia laevis]|nr:hypothetical protein CF335_g7798 [Tilletia laevis]